MNDIDSHKHASYFKGPVRERDAPGYKDIVYVPQNLKAIRAAISAGNRIVAAASSAAAEAEGDTSAVASPAAGTSSSSSASVLEIPRTADMAAGRVIVNGTQLERELLRMLANAFMFNPGDDGMAEITREMFHDVEQKLTAWRGGTERFISGGGSSGGGGSGSAGGDEGTTEEESGKGSVKRRKV